MSVVFLDATGLSGPQPLLRMTLAAADLADGDILEVIADYPGFEVDLTLWCRRLHKTLVKVSDEGVYRRRAEIRF